MKNSPEKTPMAVYSARITSQQKKYIEQKGGSKYLRLLIDADRLARGGVQDANK